MVPLAPPDGEMQEVMAHAAALIPAPGEVIQA